MRGMGSALQDSVLLAAARVVRRHVYNGPGKIKAKSVRKNSESATNRPTVHLSLPNKKQRLRWRGMTFDV